HHVVSSPLSLHDALPILGIRTPEGIVFSLVLAGPVTRFLALTIDLMCISLLMSILDTVLVWLSFFLRDWVTALIVISYFAVSVGDRKSTRLNSSHVAISY